MVLLVRGQVDVDAVQLFQPQTNRGFHIAQRPRRREFFKARCERGQLWIKRRVQQRLSGPTFVRLIAQRRGHVPVGLADLRPRIEQILRPSTNRGVETLLLVRGQRTVATRPPRENVEDALPAGLLVGESILPHKQRSRCAACA